MTKHIYRLLLELQSALINAIPPQLRAVSVDIDYTKKLFLFYFYLNCEVTDELFDLCSISTFEVDFYLPDYKTQDIISYLDASLPIPIRGKFAFLRNEQNLPAIAKEPLGFLLKEYLPLVVLRLSMQQALLGKVTPELRHVCVQIDPSLKTLECIFTYDGEISEKNREFASAALEEATSLFAEYEKKCLIHRLDFPTPIFADRPFLDDRRAVYMRQERKY